MDTEFTISRTDEPDGPLRHVGPQGFEYPFEIRVPVAMQRRVTYAAQDLEVTVNLVFPGERIEIRELHVSGGDGYIATQYLTGLGLPRVIRAIALDSIPNSARWLPTETGQKEKDLSYKYLAELYWFEHISWGSPRSAIMKYTSWSRANTNWHLRKIAKEFPLPGPHSERFYANRTTDGL
jgi:hypothetical protein